MVNLIWFQTTKGHCGQKDLFKYTLNNLKRNINLDYFSNKFLSLKVFNDDNYEGILKNFQNFNSLIWKKNDLRINDSSSTIDYSYYLITNYLVDLCNFYSTINNYSEYSYLIEDDSPEIVLNGSLQSFIEESVNILKSNKNIFSINLRRVGLKSDSSYLNHDLTFDGNFSKESHLYNFQNQVFRTKDMISVLNFIKSNYQKFMFSHPELALEIGIQNKFENSINLTYNPALINSIHIGVENFNKYIQEYNL